LYLDIYIYIYIHIFIYITGFIIDQGIRQ